MQVRSIILLSMKESWVDWLIAWRGLVAKLKGKPNTIPDWPSCFIQRSQYERSGVLCIQCVEQCFVEQEGTGIAPHQSVTFSLPGFKGVESRFPADHSVEELEQARETAGVEHVLLNAFQGAWIYLSCKMLVTWLFLIHALLYYCMHVFLCMSVMMHVIKHKVCHQYSVNL